MMRVWWHGIGIYLFCEEGNVLQVAYNGLGVWGLSMPTKGWCLPLLTNDFDVPPFSLLSPSRYRMVL